jgi:hypothetical protein
MIGAYGRHIEERHFMEYGELRVKKGWNCVGLLYFGVYILTRCVSCDCLQDYVIFVNIL